MAGNAGHPFYGNQYTKSNYSGGYTYDWVPNAISEVTEVFTRSTTHTPEPSYKKSNLIIPRFSSSSVSSDMTTSTKSYGAEIAIGAAVLAGITAVSFFVYNHFKKKKAKAEIQSLKLENVGTCQYCNDPLTGSEYVSKTDSEIHKAYIICKHCGKQNFAWYPEDKRTNNLMEGE